MKSMINAIIYHGENTLVLELPRSIYDIHEKLMSIGCPIAPGRIPLTDNEDDALRVKLYSRIEIVHQPGNKVRRYRKKHTEKVC